MALLESLRVTPSPILSVRTVLVKFSRFPRLIEWYSTVDPAYLDDDFDVLIQTAAFKASRQMGKTAPFSATVAIEVVPGEQLLPFNSSDAVYSQVVKSSFSPVYHPLGSCAMMSKALGGSVDPELKVSWDLED